jgi:hypothetical protein
VLNLLIMEDSTVFGLALKITKKTSKKNLVCWVLILDEIFIVKCIFVFVILFFEQFRFDSAGHLCIFLCKKSVC